MTLTPIATADAKQESLLAQIEAQFRAGSAAKPIDKRRNKRRAFTGSVSIQPCDPQGRIVAPPIEGQAINLSLWGLQFTTREKVEVGHYLALSYRLRIRDTQRTVVMLSEVRHVEAGRPEGLVVGCEFRETLCSNLVS